MESNRAERKSQGYVLEALAVHFKVHVSRSLLRLVTTALGLLALLTAFCGAAPAQEEQGTLMLVREWSPQAGKLTGWLPTHQLAIAFQLEDPKGQTVFELNEAVTIIWMKDKRKAAAFTDDVRVSPEAREFEGQKWLPLSRDSNLVHIKKKLFLVRGIAFGDSRNKQATTARLEASAK